MVRIIFLNKNHNLAFFHCLPEGKEDNSFDIGIDMIDEKIVFNTLNRNNAYVAHAAWKIIEFFKDNNHLPQEITSVWV